MAAYGVYRAKVVNTKDPFKQNRLVLKIPALTGSATTTWATPQVKTAVLPSVGDMVFCSFQGGDLAHPVWWGGEPDVSGQTNDLWLNTIQPYVDNGDSTTLASAETYAYDQAGHANAATTTTQTIASGSTWADIAFQSFTYSRMPGIAGNPFSSPYFNSTIDGLYTFSGIAHLGAFTGWVGIRCISGGGSILSSPPPFDGSSLFNPEISCSGTLRIASGVAIKLQLRASNGVVINGASFDIALVKKF